MIPMWCECIVLCIYGEATHCEFFFPFGSPTEWCVIFLLIAAPTEKDITIEDLTKKSTQEIGFHNWYPTPIGNASRGLCLVPPSLKVKPNNYVTVHLHGWAER